ncbi:hypothetical protein AVEN_96636-1 [Araneus ventricosus]|uniref:Uncharacterized protein n=1 Tax=Araneus ventricosus TaxID=182803 RepID=A0A4Y2E9L5_ARAVE|nr:hypothetical protein AVEN_96636-1 [Araneus ventricosus]
MARQAKWSGGYPTFNSTPLQLSSVFLILAWGGRISEEWRAHKCQHQTFFYPNITFTSSGNKVVDTADVHIQFTLVNYESKNNVIRQSYMSVR